MSNSLLNTEPIINNYVQNWAKHDLKTFKTCSECLRNSSKRKRFTKNGGYICIPFYYKQYRKMVRIIATKTVSWNIPHKRHNVKRKRSIGEITLSYLWCMEMTVSLVNDHPMLTSQPSRIIA
jgi:hypothetical protein